MLFGGGTNRFVKHAAAQSVVLWGGYIVIMVVLNVLFALIHPLIFLGLILVPILGLVFFVAWVYTTIMGFQGQGHHAADRRAFRDADLRDSARLTRAANRNHAGMPAYRSSFPRIAFVVVAPLLPESGDVFGTEFDPANPLGGLPEVEFRNERPGPVRRGSVRAPCRRTHRRRARRRRAFSRAANSSCSLAARAG